MVSRLKHENFVELVGYCMDGSLRVLAFEYASKGSLHDILHGEHVNMKLSCRLKPCQGVGNNFVVYHGLGLINDVNVIKCEMSMKFPKRPLNV